MDFEAWSEVRTYAKRAKRSLFRFCIVRLLIHLTIISARCMSSNLPDLHLTDLIFPARYYGEFSEWFGRDVSSPLTKSTVRLEAFLISQVLELIDLCE